MKLQVVILEMMVNGILFYCFTRMVKFFFFCCTLKIGFYSVSLTYFGTKIPLLLSPLTLIERGRQMVNDESVKLGVIRKIEILGSKIENLGRKIDILGRKTDFLDLFKFLFLRLTTNDFQQDLFGP
uniref:Uncharacterized protein n=1 Tax=Strigamia maritima TaxID=126957 RepID=T1JER1_STRMM